MSDESIKRPRGRPRKIKPEQHATPTIKEGASWHVGVPEIEQDELKRRHNETLEKVLNANPIYSGVAISSAAIEPNSVIQVKVDPRMGQLVLVGEADGDLLHCYQFSFDGIEYMTVKQSDCVVIGGPRKGMRVMKYEKPENSPAQQQND